jgi:hypothetical protein
MRVKKGYKAFDENLECRGFQYEIGKTYEELRPLNICNVGFHYCEKVENVYGYYPRSSKTRICEIEDIGESITEGDKSCTNKIRVVREIVGKELIDLILKGNNSGNYNSGDYNSGDYNSGYRNSGGCNSGNYNSGYRNSGGCNSGNYNSGSCNSGYRNSGSCNSGNYNSGDYNSGNYNSGYRNSGGCNSGNYNSGFFNTSTPYVRLFNKATKLRWDDPTVLRLDSLNVFPILQWVYSEDMTEEEKRNNKSHETTGGFLRKTNKTDWSRLTDSDKETIRSLPNFDNDIFEQITGVRI